MHRKLIGVLSIVGVIATGCGKTGSVAGFAARGTSGFAQRSASQSFSWTGATAIDVVTSSTAPGSGANDDLTCTTLFGTKGCMQSPPVMYSDSRWHIGFTENYLPADNNAGVKYSLMVNMTNLITGAFGTLLGSGLGLIDSGRGIDPAIAAATNTSSRYLSMAKFPNGNVIGVFAVDMTGGIRTIFANIYDSASDTWGTARQLSTTNRATDLTADFTETITNATLGTTAGTTFKTNYCRPTVATSGDNSALIAWCQDDGTGASEIRFTRFANGAWTQAAGTSSQLVDDGASEYAFAGFHGSHNQYPPASVLTVSITPGDIFSGSLHTTGTTVDVATVKAVNAFAGVGQFNVVTDAFGIVQTCSTLQNMANAFLAKPVVESDGVTHTQLTTTLSQLGVSAIVNPSCSQSDSTTWRISLFYNRSLNPVFREVSGGTSGTTYYMNELWTAPVSVGTFKLMGTGNGPAAAPCNAGECFLPPAEAALTAAHGLPRWQRSSEVAVAGDGYGNYAMVRSIPMTTFKNLDVSSNGVLPRGRALVGHEYVAGSGARWKQRTGAAAAPNHEPATYHVSGPPVCNDGTDNYQCSVRNPKFLMSDGGKGLILYTRQQTTRPNASSTTNPVRLFYATYGVATGFSGVANILDEDILCDASSTANDESVCETGQYGAAGPTRSNACISAGEASQSSAVTATHDVTPVAATMNALGQGVVAFAKRGRSSTDASTCSTNIRIHVVTYDPNNGFGSIEAIDDDAGMNMHPAVAITPNGNIAVVWEQQVSTTVKYVYLRTKISGSWSAARVVNDNTSMQNASDSMMPSVGIRDNGEIVVTYTYGSSHAARRQYVNYYYYH